MDAKEYIIKFLIGTEVSHSLLYYGDKKGISFLSQETKLIIIKSNFFDDNVFCTDRTLPNTPFPLLPNTDIPFLFGEPRLEKTTDGKIILYADLVASAYFLLSRYEEIIKPECRDQHGRFLAKDSIVFQQGYGMRPLVDEWGRYLRTLLRASGVDIHEKNSEFRKIYLTHDVDMPFLFWRKEQVIKQFIKNLIHHGPRIPHPLKVYKTGENDPYNTFAQIIDYDSCVKESLGENVVESIYFIITAGDKNSKDYCNIDFPKFQKLLKNLLKNKSKIGLHVSYEAGADTSLIKREILRLPNFVDKEQLKSRHHFLRWQEPEMVDAMEYSGIREDFTLGYADSIGFRVGTCHPYYFINPKTKRITNILIHPLQIMECSLYDEQYQNLEFNRAYENCISIINTVKQFGGELDLLFHNTSLIDNDYYNNYYGLKLYEAIINYLVNQ